MFEKNEYVLLINKKGTHRGIIKITSSKTGCAIERIFRGTDYQIRPLNIFKKDYQREILVRFTR